MHELSIIHSIIEAATEEVNRHGATHATIEAIDLEIGRLAGVETDTIMFLWTAAVEHSILGNACLSILQTPGKGACSDCSTEFALENFFDPCPNCGSHFVEVRAGEELRIKSMILAEN